MKEDNKPKLQNQSVKSDESEALNPKIIEYLTHLIGGSSKNPGTLKWLKADGKIVDENKRK